MDIITCFIALIGTILSQIENEDFYNNNYHDRVNVVKICNELDLFQWNLSEINFSKFELNYINTKEKFEQLNIKNVVIFHYI